VVADIYIYIYIPLGPMYPVSGGISSNDGHI
jgi:hypothetical protein